MKVSSYYFNGWELLETIFYFFPPVKNNLANYKNFSLFFGPLVSNLLKNLKVSEFIYFSKVLPHHQN